MFLERYTKTHEVGNELRTTRGSEIATRNNLADEAKRVEKSRMMEVQPEQGRPVHILLVEDDEIDVEAILRAFHRQKIGNPITVVSDGIEALELLRGVTGHAKLTYPYLILLDISLPRMNGIEFLQTIRQDPILERTIVFVLTTSERDEDKMAAYNEQIAGYLVKSRAGIDFSRVVTMLNSFWRIVEFPPEVQ
jgi:CheY-like chemotaxis protein